MKIAYLIDRDALGGGMEYIRRQIALQPNDECRVFFSERGECTAQQMDEWGAEEIKVNHLKALVQLLGNPFRHPSGKTIFIVHGIHLRKYDFLPKSPINRLKRCLRKTLEAYLYHRCDRIVALTRTDYEDILRLYGRTLSVEIVPNTLDGWEPKLEKSLPLGIMGEFKYICIGRFDFQKGQDQWIREISKKRDGRTLFIGEGPMLSECRRLAREFGVEELCVFAGAIPEAERYLKSADVVVSPSRWEGMPYLMMKARALGCQILATDCPGNRDVLQAYDHWERLFIL